MTSNSDGKFLSRFVAVVLVGLAFAASLAMVAQSERSLFDEPLSAAAPALTEVAVAE
jgi:hypothetical protein